MGILTRLWPSQPAPVPRVEPQLVPETRAIRPYHDGWGATLAGAGGAPVSPHAAEGLSSVLACVELITGAIASLPAALTRDARDGQVPAPATATAWALLRRPNPRQSWPACWSMLVASVLLHGNGVAALVRDGRGAVTALAPIPWAWLSPQVVQGAGGPRLVYDVASTTPEANLLGLPRRLLDTDVLHLRGRSDNGLIGRSVLARAAGVVREGAELATVAEATWQNGLRPSGYLKYPGLLSPDQVDRLEAMAGRYRGAMNAGRVPILSGGLEFAQLGLSSVDAEFLASRQFSVAEVARLFNVPLGLIQPGSGAQPYEALLAAFAQLALAPLIASIEAEFDAAVLPPGLHLQLDMSGLLRGNFSAMTGALCAGVQSGVLTANDARRGLGLPAHADGDALRPGQGAWPADAKGVPHLGPSPGHTGTGLPDAGTNNNEGAA